MALPTDLSAGPLTSAGRRWADRLIDGIEWIAAGFVGLVAADIFISVLLRYFFNITISDGYDFGRLFLGILIFWGIAATSYRGAHITVDLLWEVSSKRWRRVIDIVATLVLLFVVSVQTVMLFDKVSQTRAQNVLTYDLHWPAWPFSLVAWLGDAAAVLLIAVRTFRLLFAPATVNEDHTLAPVDTGRRHGRPREPRLDGLRCQPD